MRGIETRLCALAACAAMALAGCGGGDDGPATGTGGGTPASAEQAQAAADAYGRELDAYARELRRALGTRRELARLAGRPPALEALSGDEPSYAAARATAERVDAIAAELRLIAGSPAKRDSRLYLRLYRLAADQWSAGFRRNNRFYDGTVPWVYGPRSDAKRADEVVHRRWTAYMRDELAGWRRYRRQLAKVPARGELHRSFVAYEQMEVDVARAFMREFVDHLRAEPVATTQLGYYTAQAVKFSPYQVPVPVMWRKDVKLLRGFVRAIDRLADGRPASVGDAYRRVIAGAFVSPLRKMRHRESIVTQQLWMLFRIRELEDTPADAYEDARQTILLQGIDDVRNPYARLIEVYAEADGAMSAGKRRPPRKMTSYLDWAHEQLDRPAPPILAPTVRAIDRGLERVPKVRSRVLFKTLDDYVRATNRIERDLRRGARRVDDPRRLRAATVEALAATRPEPTGER